MPTGGSRLLLVPPLTRGNASSMPEAWPTITWSSVVSSRPQPQCRAVRDSTSTSPRWRQQRASASSAHWPRPPSIAQQQHRACPLQACKEGLRAHDSSTSGNNSNSAGLRARNDCSSRTESRVYGKFAVRRTSARSLAASSQQRRQRRKASRRQSHQWEPLASTGAVATSPKRHQRIAGHSATHWRHHTKRHGSGAQLRRLNAAQDKCAAALPSRSSQQPRRHRTDHGAANQRVALDPNPRQQRRRSASPT